MRIETGEKIGYDLYRGRMNLLLFFTVKGLSRLLFEGGAEKPMEKIKSEEIGEEFRHRVFREAERQLDKYFGGEPMKFSLPLDLTCTNFDRRVLEATSRIPYGKTKSYGQIARDIGSLKAARAVGGALGRNPVPIIIPCHRVLGSNNALGGFSSGLELKKTLLKIEGIDPSRLKA